MRRLPFVIVAALALMSATSMPLSAATITVQIKRTGFSPARITINQTDAVTFANADKVSHQVVADGGAFASPILAPGKSYTFTFHQGGTFRYHDGLHPSLLGTIVVRGAPPSVTLAASTPIVKFGTSLVLSGGVSSKRAGESVTLVSLPFGQTTKQVLATLQTTTGGAFSFTVTPQIATTYQVQWRSAESSVTAQVAPAIKLPPPSRSGYFHFYVTAATSFAGHYVYLQRFSPLGAQWVNIRKLVLGAKSGRLITLKSVQALLPRGRSSIRVFLPADQAGSGYLETGSGSQPVTRR